MGRLPRACYRGLMRTDIDRNAIGIAFILAGVTAISVNDMLIKQLSGGYPLHQMVFIRSSIGILFSLVLVRWEGGFHLLRTSTPGLHVLRGVMVVISNMSFFAALAVPWGGGERRQRNSAVEGGQREVSWASSGATRSRDPSAH